ncbi:hypothetical protein [Halalkalibacter akibai]|uniref:Uncharacterized protein n=1 Tax=Halalkalibacter akibai (strain ATCC 43226 / DSM 21942 / CIP 109018 / JCM 9157 / 1139) TaxID=1236973 RepID=W4QZI1_HALA3|nr:hypothetical protein [Halalkalibacter akibai]GAE37073.1 hypothetical protein JCM9157_4317 [Halalkalibacter akibai JCM 9157]
MYGPQDISVQYLPPTVVSQYVGQWITTSIPTYGQVTAYITDYNRRTGMVSMFMYRAPSYQPQFIQVHHSDLVGIAPYYGPIPPRPTPRPPRPWQPGQPWQPGTGGGFWPWLFYQTGVFGQPGQPYRDDHYYY